MPRGSMKLIKNQYSNIKPYITKDGSIIRELMHPNIHGNSNQSLAEATIPVGFTTFLHMHKTSEEIYYIIEGEGLMTINDRKFKVKNGDIIYIPPRHYHNIKNTGNVPLKILCCCSPPYSHEDTEILLG